LQVTHHICTRNCYDTCSFMAHVEGGRLLKVSGDPWQTYTMGTLCCKGYNYVKYVYHPERILYPLRQTPRGSGNWQRITWDEALGRIADAILTIRQETGSFLPLTYLGGTGNTGVLAQSMLHMLSSLGPITQVKNNRVGAAGQDAQLLDFGEYTLRDPEEMKEADLIILWGVNPTSTAIHQMRILQRARRKGSKIISIDVFPSRATGWVDEFILVHPGGDGALALAVLRELLYKNGLDHYFLSQKTTGWEDFRDWLLEADPTEFNEISGASNVEISTLADKICNSQAVAFWLGKGLQRYSNSGQSIRSIHALAAAGGILGESGGGVYAPVDLDYLLKDIWLDQGELQNRKIFHLLPGLAQELSILNSPPRLLWITQGNPLVQATELQSFKKVLTGLDLIITTDHFLTETASNSDIFLPATTLFETKDVIVGSWNKWVGLNGQAIKPLGESKSELEIAQNLTRVLNQHSPGICSFPADRSLDQWLDAAIALIGGRLRANGVSRLKHGPQKLSAFGLAPKLRNKYSYRFIAPEAMDQGCPEIPSLISPATAPIGYPYRLISVHQVDSFNSQLGNMPWLAEGKENAQILLGGALAKRKGLYSGDFVTIYNQHGEIILRVRVIDDFPEFLLIATARTDVNGKSINSLVGAQLTDLGLLSRGFSDIAYHDTFVNLAAR